MGTETDEASAEVAALRAQREELHRELVRKTYRIGELEEEVKETRREYEESLSWRLTRPVRALRTLLAKARR